MGCCEGACSCGKGSSSPFRENLAMVQMSTSQEILSTHDWIKDLASFAVKEEVLEVRFKNNRKAFYRNPRGIRLNKDDRVLVETEGGHDVGTISLSADLAEKQFEQTDAFTHKGSLSQIYRQATEGDLDKWLRAKRRERQVLLEARSIASRMGLKMSIVDVEFRGDAKKVSISYSADGRLDLRELIRQYARAFGVRIEMKQIGVRQNVAKIEGIDRLAVNAVV